MAVEQTAAQKASTLRLLGWVCILIGLCATGVIVATLLKLWSAILAASILIALWPAIIGGLLIWKAKRLIREA